MQLGLTGNIATGKSTVYRWLTERDDVVGFDADAIVHELYKSDEVQEQIVSALGREVLDGNGYVCRSLVREMFLRQPDVRGELERIFHPLVHDHYLDLLEGLRPGQTLLADIPLLYEKETPYEFDAVITVACSPQIQLTRLMLRSNLDKATAMKMINKQVALSQKILKAEHVVWNNGDLDQLQRQLNLLVQHIF